MDNLLKGLAIAGLITASSLASAQWSVGGGYNNINAEDDFLDISLSAAYINFGYTYGEDAFTFTPDLRVGFAISDDTVRFQGVDVDVELDNYIVTSIRAQYNVTDSFAVFLQPSYGRFELTASASANGFSASESDDSWEFGFGGGATFSVTDNLNIEAFYEDFDGVDSLSVGLRYNF